jgi:hypothetical protein
MKDKLKAIIEKARKNKWREGEEIVWCDMWKPSWREEPDFVMEVEGTAKQYAIEEVIFSHDFLKAYFGEEKERFGECNCKTSGCIVDHLIVTPGWEHHAQQLVLADNRIEYLYQFIDD